MVNLNVKTCRQPYGTSICGPCCVRMCAQYFGKKLSAQDAKQRCHCASSGSTETALALALNRMGLRGILYAIPTGGMFFGKYVGMPTKRVIASLKTRAALTMDRLTTTELREAAWLLEQDAIKFEFPGRECIERELRRGHPWIVSCLYYIISEEQERYGAEITHFVVIQGYDKKHFIINDPVSGVRKVDKDLMQCAVYSASSFEISAICVSNNRR